MPFSFRLSPILSPSKGLVFRLALNVSAVQTGPTKSQVLKQTPFHAQTEIEFVP